MNREIYRTLKQLKYKQMQLYNNYLKPKNPPIF